MNLLKTTLVIVLLTASVFPTAQACGFQNEADVSIGGFYVDWSSCQPECTLDLVVYEETNGIDGLQRRDTHVDHTCGGEIPADTPLILGIL
jgi:hypothetical protein